MSKTLDIRLLGKEYKVACAPEQRYALQAAAALLNVRLNEAAASGKAKGERLAVMVALNLAHELLARSGDSPAASETLPLDLDSDTLLSRIEAIESRIDVVLNQPA